MKNDSKKWKHAENLWFWGFRRFLEQYLTDLDLAHLLVISDFLCQFIQLCKNHSKAAMFFHGCRWYALRLIHKGSREIPSHRKLMILRFQVFLRQLLIDLDLVHRLVISDLLSWSIKPCKNPSKVSIFFVGGCRWYALRLIRNGSREIPPCRWYALRLIHNGSREIPSHRKLMILRFQEFLWQLLIDLDLVHRLVISDLLSWFITPCRNHSKVSIVFFDVFRWYALRLIRNGSREIPPRRFCSAAYRYESGTNDVEWIHVCSSMLLSSLPNYARTIPSQQCF